MVQFTDEAHGSQETQEEDGPPCRSQYSRSTPLKDCEDAAAWHGKDQGTAGWQTSRRVDAQDIFNPTKFGFEMPSST